MKLFFLLFFLSACSTFQYNYSPTTVNSHGIRYGIKDQSVVVVLPIVQDRTKAVGSRTILDIRTDITTTTVSTREDGKAIRYRFPNGAIFGLKWKF